MLVDPLPTPPVAKEEGAGSWKPERVGERRGGKVHPSANTQGREMRSVNVRVLLTLQQLFELLGGSRRGEFVNYIQGGLVVGVGFVDVYSALKHHKERQRLGVVSWPTTTSSYSWSPHSSLRGSGVCGGPPLYVRPLLDHWDRPDPVKSGSYKVWIPKGGVKKMKLTVNRPSPC